MAAAEEREEGEALPEAIQWMEWKREKGPLRYDIRGSICPLPLP